MWHISYVQTVKIFCSKKLFHCARYIKNIQQDPPWLHSSSLSLYHNFHNFVSTMKSGRDCTRRRLQSWIKMVFLMLKPLIIQLETEDVGKYAQIITYKPFGLCWTELNSIKIQTRLDSVSLLYRTCQSAQSCTFPFG